MLKKKKNSTNIQFISTSNMSLFKFFRKSNFRLIKDKFRVHGRREEKKTDNKSHEITSICVRGGSDLVFSCVHGFVLCVTIWSTYACYSPFSQAHSCALGCSHERAWIIDGILVIAIRRCRCRANLKTIDTSIQFGPVYYWP